MKKTLATLLALWMVLTSAAAAVADADLVPVVLAPSGTEAALCGIFNHGTRSPGRFIPYDANYMKLPRSSRPEILFYLR